MPKYVVSISRKFSTEIEACNKDEAYKIAWKGDVKEQYISRLVEDVQKVGIKHKKECTIPDAFNTIDQARGLIDHVCRSLRMQKKREKAQELFNRYLFHEYYIGKLSETEALELVKDYVIPVDSRGK